MPPPRAWNSNRASCSRAVSPCPVSTANSHSSSNARSARRLSTGSSSAPSRSRAVTSQAAPPSALRHLAGWSRSMENRPTCQSSSVRGIVVCRSTRIGRIAGINWPQGGHEGALLAKPACQSTADSARAPGAALPLCRSAPLHGGAAAVRAASVGRFAVAAGATRLARVAAVLAGGGGIRPGARGERRRAVPRGATAGLLAAPAVAAAARAEAGQLRPLRALLARRKAGAVVAASVTAAVARAASLAGSATGLAGVGGHGRRAIDEAGIGGRAGGQGRERARVGNVGVDLTATGVFSHHGWTMVLAAGRQRSGQDCHQGRDLEPSC